MEEVDTIQELHKQQVTKLCQEKHELSQLLLQKSKEIIDQHNKNENKAKELFTEIDYLRMENADLQDSLVQLYQSSVVELKVF